MIVCICYGVSDRAIHAAIREGADTVEEIGGCTRAGTCCGSCEEVLEELLDEQLIGPARLARGPGLTGRPSTMPPSHLEVAAAE
ncbi:MAG: (2Fe-2S)-binding protein [Myxococcota bacterium]